MTEDEEHEEALGYEKTLMFGHYKKDLEDYAKAEAQRLQAIEKLRNKEIHITIPEPLPEYNPGNCLTRTLAFIWQKSFGKLGVDWVFLALLGIICSLLSFSMDWVISHCQRARFFLAKEFAMPLAFKYICWVGVPVTLTMFSAGFVHIMEPKAIGSGIPEMKTILRGVPVKEYLTFRMLLSKVVGLVGSLSSGLPLGKEGPFVHIASIVSNLLSKVITSFKSIYENESRKEEMLAAACAVGVACSFAAPIGGVLFSIEVTSEYFRVRNYWRGFFAACFGTLVWRLLHVWQQDEETITALFKTSFESSFPFDPYELPVYAVLGIITGILGVMFVKLHRKIVIFNRTCLPLKRFLQKQHFIYPVLVTLFISTLTFPQGFGQFIAAELTNHESVNELFRNKSWIAPNMDIDDYIVASHWTTAYTGIHINLGLFALTTFFTTALAATLPIPSGVFIPTLKIGAALGRLVGEAMFLWFPTGMGSAIHQINPGAYAVAGAAAFAGSVTHTISTTVIIFELTGQLTHVLPIIITTLVSNAFAQLMESSIYDSIIQLKKLPYLPPIISASSQAHNVYVEDIMVRDIICIWKGVTYKQLQDILNKPRKLSSYPLVDSPESMFLLGSVPRLELKCLLKVHLNRAKRLHEQIRRQLLEETQRRSPRESSRFQVYPTSNSARASPRCSPPPSPPPRLLTTPRSSQRKSRHSPAPSPYSTITSQDSKLRIAFEAMKKSFTLPDLTDKGDASISNTPTSGRKYKQFSFERIPEMSPEEQLAWEEEQLSLPVDFTNCHIDPAPFQLVEGTSLLKVHSLFSMLGLNHAYVTAIGRLVGVVALKEVRLAVENLYSSPPLGSIRYHSKILNSHHPEKYNHSSKPPPSHHHHHASSTAQKPRHGTELADHHRWWNYAIKGKSAECPV